MIDRAPIRLVPASDADLELWRLTKEVSERLRGIPWALIGGQMVAIIEAEYGGSMGRATGDVDVLVDVRALSSAPRAAAERLTGAGFEPQYAEDGLAYRFTRGGDVVDILAPDNLGTRVDITTVAPGHTLEVVGGTQALSRCRSVLVDAGSGLFELPVPSLIGAIIIKARAASSVLEDRQRHERDLARMLILVPDPSVMRGEITTRERGYLRAHRGLLRIDHPAWRGIPAAEDGTLALRILIE